MPCARAGIRIDGYTDDAVGTLLLHSGGGRFESILLRPTVMLSEASRAAEAQALHHEAHARCFIAASCSAPIHCEPRVVERPDQEEADAAAQP